jgi:hypothetical protein
MKKKGTIISNRTPRSLSPKQLHRKTGHYQPEIKIFPVENQTGFLPENNVP